MQTGSCNQRPDANLRIFQVGLHSEGGRIRLGTAKIHLQAFWTAKSSASAVILSSNRLVITVPIPNSINLFPSKKKGKTWRQ